MPFYKSGEREFRSTFGHVAGAPFHFKGVLPISVHVGRSIYRVYALVSVEHASVSVNVVVLCVHVLMCM